MTRGDTRAYVCVYTRADSTKGSTSIRVETARFILHARPVIPVPMNNRSSRPEETLPRRIGKGKRGKRAKNGAAASTAEYMNERCDRCIMVTLLRNLNKMHVQHVHPGRGDGVYFTGDRIGGLLAFRAISSFQIARNLQVPWDREVSRCVACTAA